MLRLNHLLKSVEEMNSPQPIALKFKSIRESEGLASFKPDPFCHCWGTKQPLFTCLYCFFFLQSWTFTAWQKIPASLQSTEILFNASKIEVCWGRGWVEAANSWDCTSSHSSSAPTGHVVSRRLEGGKERLFLEAAQCTEGERKKIVF